MKFFPKVSPEDAKLYNPIDNPYPFREAEADMPDIYWHNYDRNICIRYVIDSIYYHMAS